MAIRVGINGFGRIGRNFFRAQLERRRRHRDRRGERPRRRETMAHLLKYDSTSARSGRRRARDGVDPRGGEEIKLLSERDPARSRGATSASTSCSSRPASSPKREGAQKHLDAGAKKVVISAPATDPDVTLVLGVNDDDYDRTRTTSSRTPPARRTASRPSQRCCTTRFTIEQGFMTTIHA
jgi:glyceraldehyde 3-phosphate dehydrogenase